MSVHIAWCSVCILALVFCVELKPFQNQDCSTEKMENVTVDIKAALSSGIWGTDPVHTASSEACVKVCCLGAEIADSKECNLVVFNAGRRGSYPNCYLFYYPTKEVYPTKPAVGLVTFRIIKDAEDLQTASSPNKLSPSIVNGSVVSPQASAFDSQSPTRLPDWSGTLQQSVVSQVRELLGHIEKHFYKVDGHPLHLNGEGAAISEHLDASQMHENSSGLPTSTADTMKHVVPMVQPIVRLPTVPAGTQAPTTPYISPNNAAATRSATTYPGDARVALTPRSTIAPRATTTSGSTTSNLPPSTASISSASLPEVHRSNKQWDLEGDILGGVTGTEDTSHFAEKNILLAALLFGVMFLLLIVVLVGSRMLESLWQRRYTRLDYLINGMYANM